MKRRDFLRKSLLAATGSMILGGGIMKAVENLNTKNSSRMKIVVLTGSPRRNGNSAYLAEQFIKGAQEKDMRYTVSIAPSNKWNLAVPATVAAWTVRV